MEDQTRLLELEQVIREIAEQLGSDENAIQSPGLLVQELQTRLQELEELRLDHWQSRFELSRHLALRQIDSMLETGVPKPDTPPSLKIIDRRARSSDAPLFSLLIVVDRPVSGADDPTLYHLLLVQAAQRIMLNTRGDDLVSRYREEGFLLISSAATLDQAKGHAVRMRQATSTEPVRMGTIVLGLSVTIAIVVHEQSDSSSNETLRLAWEALHKVQATGSRKILVFSRQETHPGRPAEARSGPG